ncbi:hypothetical protein B4Q13_23605, partial [Lacticaseibacillus rhamnosus]
EADASPLDPAEAAKLAEGWPFRFETDPARLTADLVSAGRAGRREVWRVLVFAALAGLLFVAVSINIERILRYPTLPRLAV